MKKILDIDLHLIFHQLILTINNRELAYIIWFLIAFCLVMLSSKLRKSVRGVFNSLFNWKFNITYIATIAYFALMINILEYFNFWDNSLIKDTVFWLVLTGTSLMFRIATNNDPLVFLKDTFRDSIKIAAFLSFVLNLTVFTFWSEFIAIPILFILGGMHAVSKHKKEHEQVAKALEVMGKIASIFLLGYIVRDMFINYQSYLTLQKAKEFFLPILLTLLFGPFLALLNLIVQYEEIANSLKRVSKSTTHYYKMLFGALLYFNFNIKGAIRWRNSFVYINPEEELWSSMRNIRLLQIEENTPPQHPELEGWTPIDAKQFLTNKKLHIKDYNSNLGDIWEGKSKNLKLDDSFMAGICSYSIKGNKHVVQQLKLHLTCYDSSRIEDLMRFLGILKDLYFVTIYENMPYKIKNSILNYKNLNYESSYTNVIIYFNHWKNEKKGYNLYTTITHKNLNQIEKQLGIDS